MSEANKTTVANAPAGTPETTRPNRVWRPLADIVETRDGIMLMLEMPGVRADDVDVTLERRVLTIRARSSVQQPEKLALVHAEFEPGDFERAFTLSADFDAEGIKAQMKHGVLTLQLPRAEAQKPRSIRVEAA